VKGGLPITLRSVMTGTDLTIVQDGLPPVIPVGFCYRGRRESLEVLTRLVEPDIPAGA